MKRKCLIVSHVPLDSVYGAGTSLRTFLEHQDFLNVDLILPLFIGNLFNLPQQIRDAHKVKPKSVEKLFFLPLPFVRCHDASNSISKKLIFAFLLNDIISFLLLPVIFIILKNKRYEFVYFNSVVLNPLILDEKPSFVHIREILDKNFKSINKVINNLKKASALIFIDRSTNEAFVDLAGNRPFPPRQIINNPFDMNKARYLRKSKKDYIYKKLNINSPPNKIFSYIGMIRPVKGVDKIIKAFMEADLLDAVLLIAGAGMENYEEYCRSLASKQIGKKIFFLGMLNKAEVAEVYAVSDYVVRADPDFRIGRTTYEALFAGAYVIVPGENHNLGADPGLKSFSSRILLYQPRDDVAFTEAFRSAYLQESIPLPVSAPSGNISYYCNEFKAFLEQQLNG